MTTDVTIYIDPQASNTFRLRYEVGGEIDAVTQHVIRTRLLKSFSLGREFPDASIALNILRKSKLMQTILKDEYGLSSTIINLIV
jgi:hypothetical protein